MYLDYHFENIAIVESVCSKILLKIAYQKNPDSFGVYSRFFKKAKNVVPVIKL